MHHLANALLLEIVLLAYDTLLTLPEEVLYIWNMKFKFGSALYFLARYSELLYLLILLLSYLLNISLQVNFLFDFGLCT